MFVRALQIGAGLLGVAAVLAVGFVVSMRTKFAPVQRQIRRMNRRFFNPRALATDAGQPGAYASVVHHVGRRTGTPYRTPVVAVPTGDGGLVVALPYGPDADWVRNVLAASTTTVEHEGETLRLQDPELLTSDAGNAYFPAREQRQHRLFGVRDFLLLRGPR